MNKTSSFAEQLKKGNTITYYTLGVSMRPLLKARASHVTIVPCEYAEADDIVLYVRQNGDYVLHRLIKQADGVYYMRGDNTYYLEKISASQIIGKVAYIYKGDTVIDVDSNLMYKLYVKFWNKIFPIRFLMQRFKLKIKKI